MRVDASGNVGIGVTSITASTALQVNTGGKNLGIAVGSSTTPIAGFNYYSGNSPDRFGIVSGIDGLLFQTGSVDISSGTERARITSGGVVQIGSSTSGGSGTNYIYPNDTGGANIVVTTGGYAGQIINRTLNDGTLISFKQDGTEEGTISVSGTTLSYNGGHLSRWAQMLTKPELFKGTVMSNLDAMNVYTDVDGNPVDNEQLNKVKVSDVEGDVNVAGVFVNWTHDDAHNVDEINMAMTGDMIIRIAQGVTVVRGDLLMSAGDGTAKPQGDDIVRSKTVAKVTSNHVTCTYADGSYCVPCVLMAC
jgi:hypothetical protein